MAPSSPLHVACAEFRCHSGLDHPFYRFPGEKWMHRTRQPEQAGKEQTKAHWVSLVSRSKKPGLQGTTQSVPALPLEQSSLVRGLGPQADVCSVERAHLLHCSDVRKITSWEGIILDYQFV